MGGATGGVEGRGEDAGGAVEGGTVWTDDSGNGLVLLGEVKGK